MSEKVSIIIPARNEEFLQKTIECVLEAAEEDIEIITICDGYWPTHSSKIIRRSISFITRSHAGKDNPSMKLRGSLKANIS